MPLIKIETRPRGEPPAPEPPRRPRPPERAADKGGVGAVALGALVGLAILGGLSLAIVPRLLQGDGAAAPVAPPGAPSTAPLAPGAAAANEFPASINVDYAADQVVARVGGTALTMKELEAHVRVARALGSLSGDPMPVWTDGPGMRDLQIKILKRVIDMMLLRQAMQRDAVEPMSIPVEQLLQDFLDRLGKTDGDLDQALARNGVTRVELMRWFELSRDSNTYTQVKLMEGKDPQDKALRESVLNAWLQETWQSPGLVVVEFYDPSVPAPGQAPAP
jgi:hypothetical protein